MATETLDSGKPSRLTNGQESSAPIPLEQRTFIRQARIKEEDRQVAELSISHDGEYAVAVCMALDEPREETEGKSEPIIDDGTGEPIHEPVWGDKGFLDG